VVDAVAVAASGAAEPMAGARCPFCRAAGEQAFRAGDRFYGVTDHEVDVYRCLGCASLFQYPIPDRGTIAGFYPSGYWQEGEKAGLMTRLQQTYVRWMLAADLMRWVDSMGPAKGEWLDVGCSRGDWAARIRARGWRVSGLEADPRAAAYARETHGLDVLEVDGDAWEPEPDSVDVISFFHLLEHLRDPASFLMRCHRALRPNGRILLRIPNIESWQARLTGRAWKGLEMPRHITLPSRKALHAMLENAGFRIERESTWSLRDGPTSIASSLFPAGEPTRQQIKGRAQPLATLTYLALTWLITPAELIAAAIGKGGMRTIISRKK